MVASLAPRRRSKRNESRNNRTKLRWNTGNPSKSSRTQRDTSARRRHDPLEGAGHLRHRSSDSMNILNCYSPSNSSSSSSSNNSSNISALGTGTKTALDETSAWSNGRGPVRLDDDDGTVSTSPKNTKVRMKRRTFSRVGKKPPRFKHAFLCRCLGIPGSIVKPGDNHAKHIAPPVHLQYEIVELNDLGLPRLRVEWREDNVCPFCAFSFVRSKND